MEECSICSCSTTRSYPTDEEKCLSTCPYLGFTISFEQKEYWQNITCILDRGNQSISFVLNAMIFHFVPTTVEVSLVTSLVGYQFGMGHAIVVVATTITSYLVFTVAITQCRTQFHRDMNRLENQASARVVDSILSNIIKFVKTMLLKKKICGNKISRRLENKCPGNYDRRRECR
jgi:hypothetical protein